ncbi:bifunctional peptidase and (3S)-lysyl hydroxylase Jmjd7-like [Liolophura sinensis]|uniref:bifunctional peptidase and (3S)-lysyl hydroxylase Jmjd7-like n=1 Tax=Liolophura sinensis TaxID=3198878 RepID=UPI003158FC37
MAEESVIPAAKIREGFTALAREARELYLDAEVAELTSVPDPLSFYREFVSPNKPVVIRGGLDWPALTVWTPQYLRCKAGRLPVSVAVTPNGYADAVNGNNFVMPEERRMILAEFLDIIEQPDSANGVFYIQKQNSNFTEEFDDIIGDAGRDISWATEAFGKSPDAVNFWMGDGRAVTSLHKDHYENLYCVVSGWKKFILIAPTDLPFVPYDIYKPAHYKELKGEFVIQQLDEMPEVPWIPVDPLNPDMERYPEFAHTLCYEVTVNAGDILYLPSLWFHHVRQSHGCIAVNYWYDMEFDIKYNYFKFVEKLAEVQETHSKKVPPRTTMKDSTVS